MDRSAASVHSCDADLQTPPETTTRPNPFEEDDASSRKRRRTSASASMSPVQDGSFDDFTESNNTNHIIDKHDRNRALQEAIFDPDSLTDNVQTPEASDSPTPLDPSGQLTLKRSIDNTNLKMLSTWMEQSAIKFLETSERPTVLLALQSQRKFWLSFPAIMTALTMARSQLDGSESLLPTLQNILSLYSLLTAALVKFDHVTLQQALASDAEPEDELALFSIECLHIWYDLLYIEERQTTATVSTDDASPWTRSEMSRILLSPLIAANGNSTQWISSFACDLSLFTTTPKFRLRDFTLVACIFSDCVAADHRRSEAISEDLAPSCAVGAMQQTRETWLALSDALSAIIEKNISILSSETANRLFCALANIFSYICQSDSQAERDEPDGIDHLLETYRLKHSEATSEMLQKAAPWEWRLGILAKLVQSGLMHLRVMAVNMLCSCLAEVWTQEEAAADGRQFLRHLGHVVDDELIGYIVGPSCHPEIIVASANIIVFLVLSDANTEPLLDRLWRSIESSQDPRVADAITRVTNNVLSVLRYSDLVHLCEKFDDVELKDFTPLLRNLWEALIGEMVSKAQLTSQPLPADPFLSILRLLREIPTSDNGAHYAYPDLHMAAMQRARDLLNYGVETENRKQLYQNCVSHLTSDSATTLGSLWFLSVCIRPAISSELQYLTERHDIVRVVVEELESAILAASDPSVLVLAGHANQARRDLISQIIHFQPKSITEELGTRLWEVLVGSKALNAADRIAAWQTISTVGNNSGFQNPFLQVCFSRHLPHLAASWYCDGMLNFVKENVMLRVNQSEEFSLDHEELVAKSGIEHLWQIILAAHEENIAKSAMVLLASGVYLESKAIAACTVSRAQNIHLHFVRQCLDLLREARRAVQAAPINDDADDDSAVLVEPEREIGKKKREFLRTLRLLHYFLDEYRTNPRYAAADLRSLVPEWATEMKGEPTTLQYQAFGDENNSEIKPLRIGRENSLASLLATLRDETGFQSYKAYYRGRPLIPTEIEAGKSLQELGMCDALILINKDVAASEMPSHVRPGSSPIEIEILSQFSEFWQYLIMDESIAVETYNFLLRLPADGHLMQRLMAEDTKYEDHFVADQPCRLLYTIFALMECVKETQQQRRSLGHNSPISIETKSYSAMVYKALRLLARGLDDETITQAVSARVNVPVTSALIFQFQRLLDDNATRSEDDELVHLSAKCLSLILRLGLVNEVFWLALADSPLLAELMRRTCVLSNQKQFRHFCVSIIEDSIKKEFELTDKNGYIAKYFWTWALETLTTIPKLGENCHELMKLMCSLVVKMRPKYPGCLDLESLVQQLTEYLIAHRCTEDIYQVTPGKLYECIYLYLRAHNDMLLEVVQFLDELVPFYPGGAEPYIYDLPFQFEQEKALRSPAGYVGLQNLSNTCYLNSLITQLYMNPGFRSYLLSFDVDEADDSKALLRETQRLFVYLQESIDRAVEPATFVGAIKTYDQGPIDIHSQMDVDEFYNLLFDRWEAQLPNAAARRKFRSIYGGQLVQQIKSKECGHISERLEPFSAIQCDIKGKSTLEDSLRAYVGGETMDGDNKYKCSSCDRHVDAVKRACLKDVPDNVIFHLKRFEFNLQTLQRSKIDDYFAFPDKLDLQPYTIEHLSGSTPEGKQDMFELVGVLVHAGTAESGHYYSYVRERASNQDTTTKWVEFNDDQVGLWNPSLMEASTFGGPERRSVYEENSISFDKSYSAYMLFYQRISYPSEAAEAQPVSEVGQYSYTTKGEALKEHIRSTNVLLLRRHCLFDPNHAKFVQACVCEGLRVGRHSQAGLELDGQSVGEVEAPKACKLMHRPAVLRSLLLRNPERNVRSAVGHLFVVCLEKLSRSCPELYYSRTSTVWLGSGDEDEDMDSDDAENEGMLSRAVKLLNQLWRYFQHHIRAWEEYFTTILHVAQLGREECTAILASGYLEKCLRIVTADRSMQLEPNFVKMLQNVYRRFSGQAPSYVAVLAVIEFLMDRLEPEISHETIVEAADERLTHSGEYLPWTAAEVRLLVTHPEEEDSSLFMARLLEIDQAPEVTRRILKRILRAGEIPTAKLFGLLEQTIRGDATTEPLDSYIRAASIFIDSCRHLGDAQRLIQHICEQAASFERGEGEAFLGLMWRAIDSTRLSEEERGQLRLSTLHTIPSWAPYLLQYPDSQVRNGTERLVDMALRLPFESGSTSVEAAALSSELALAIGTKCLDFLQHAHVKRRACIERDLAGVLIRVLSNCNVVVSESETLEEDVKEEFSEQQQEILEGMSALVVDRAEDEGSDWEGSALSSEPMDEDAETEEALIMLGNNGYA
ncbi:hypothetical protein MY11210_003506 [Beauveria gryllotalpidicola]